MFERIKNVVPLDNCFLQVTFLNGQSRKYDVKKLFDRFYDFTALKNTALFEQVRTDPGGYGISWNDYLDIECTELWENGVPV